MGNKILVVDDEADILMLIQGRLKANGYDVVTAGDGEEGLEKAKAESPDLILTDVLMPKMDGFAFYKELKKDPSVSDIPVLVLTAKGKTEDTFKVMGVDDFITKPFDSEELLSKVKNGLEKISTSEPKEETEEAPSEPPASEPEPPAAKPETPQEEEEEDDTDKPNCLLVAMSDDVVVLIEKILKEKGFKVTTLQKGKEAIKTAKTLIPELIIVDGLIDYANNLDRLPCFQVIEKIKKTGKLKKIPVISFTFSNEEALKNIPKAQLQMDLEKAKVATHNAGVTEFIGEFDKGTFVAAIDRHYSK